MNLLPGKARDPRGMARDNRVFVVAVLWILRTGSPWRDLPRELGNWHSTYVRFARWRDSGIREPVADVLGGGADIDQAAAPCGGAGLRVGERTIGVVGAGNHDGREGKALSGQRRKAGCLGREIGALGIGNGDQQGGPDRGM